MFNINPFQDMFKMSSYTKWYHYFWGMPILYILFMLAMISNTFWLMIESITGIFKESRKWIVKSLKR